MNPHFEIQNPAVRRGPFRAVLFDFDGTLSLIREGWPRVMVSTLLEHLHKAAVFREPESDEWKTIDRLVMAQNGAPTIRQMEVFAEEVQQRGGTPANPWEYLNDYLTRLMRDVENRWRALEDRTARQEDWVVPHAHAILANLKKRNLPIIMASGTDRDHVIYEAQLLGVADYFPNRINAPRNNDPDFSKAQVIRDLLGELGIRGEELLGFGDGIVETTEVKRVGGVAVGVASSEPGSPPGTVHPEKRMRLLAAGADIMIPDYAHQAELIRWLWHES